MLRLPLTPCNERIPSVSGIPIVSELNFPFSILDLAYCVIRIVFLPVYNQYSMDKAILETKRRPEGI